MKRLISLLLLRQLSRVLCTSQIYRFKENGETELLTTHTEGEMRPPINIMITDLNAEATRMKIASDAAMCRLN